MKKAIIVFLLTSALAVSAFAQLTFSGSVYAGIRLQSGQDADETISTYHRDDNFTKAPTFDFTATVMRENYGARLDTSFRMVGEREGDFTLNGIYGWVDFPGFLDNDSFRLTMGEISSAAWATRLDASLDEFYFDKVRGFRIEYTTPIDGLRVGAAFRANNYDLETFGQRMIFGATFIHPLFSTVFAYDLGRNAQTLFGFYFTGIPDLTVGLQLMAGNLAIWDDPDFGSPGILRVHYKVGYRIMRPLYVYLIFGQIIHGGSDMGMEWEITPGVTYRFLPNLTGSLRMTLDNFEGSPNNNLSLLTGIEYTLRGPAVFYVEYKLNLANMDTATHSVGFGITIRAF